MSKPNVNYSADVIKKNCIDAGADDVGLVDLDRNSLSEEREGILHVYSLTRSIISIIIANNRENIQSPARYVANEEYHHTGDRTSSVSREILRRLNRLGIRGVVVNRGWPMAMDRYPGKIWDVSHKIIAVEAGLGHMGMNRLVLHPKFGSCVQLESILINGVMDGKRPSYATGSALIHYILKGSRSRPNGQFVTLSELAGPLFKQASFSHSALDQPINKRFQGRILELLSKAAVLGGYQGGEAGLGGVSLIFDLLPHIPLQLIFYDRDEEFPARATLLFSLNATELIDFEVLAVLVTAFMQSLTGMNCKENLWLKKHGKWTESWLRACIESCLTPIKYCTFRALCCESLVGSAF